MDLNPRNYQNYGMIYDISYVKEIYPRVVWFARKEQAKLADAITQRYAHTAEYCDHMLQSLNKDNIHVFIEDKVKQVLEKSLGTTFLGNLAYLSLYGHETYLQLFDFLLKEIINKLKVVLKPQNMNDVKLWESEKVDRREKIPEKIFT